MNVGLGFAPKRYENLSKTHFLRGMTCSIFQLLQSITRDCKSRTTCLITLSKHRKEFFRFFYKRPISKNLVAFDGACQGEPLEDELHQGGEEEERRKKACGEASDG